MKQCMIALAFACGFTKENQDTRWVVDNDAQVALGKIGAAVALWAQGREESGEGRKQPRGER